MQGSENNEYIKPETPEDLLTCSAYLARDLVAQYFKLDALNMRDAVALYIISGYVEFKKQGKEFFDSEATIARALGLKGESVRRAVWKLIDEGIITRDGQNGDPLKKRPWKVPKLESENAENAVQDPVPHRDGVPSLTDTGTVPHGDGDTVPHRDGHLKESGSERKKRDNKEGRKGNQTPSFLSGSSFLKKKSKEDADAILNSINWKNYKLDTPKGMASVWTDLTAIWKLPSEAPASPCNFSAPADSPDSPAPAVPPSEQELRIAFRTLEQMGALKTEERVRNWLKWYVLDRGLGDTGYLTEFSYTWGEFQSREVQIKKAEDTRKAEEDGKKEAEEKQEVLDAIARSPSLSKILKAYTMAYGQDAIDVEWGAFEYLAEGEQRDDPVYKISLEDADEIIGAIDVDMDLCFVLCNACYAITKRKKQEKQESEEQEE